MSKTVSAVSADDVLVYVMEVLEDLDDAALCAVAKEAGVGNYRPTEEYGVLQEVGETVPPKNCTDGETVQKYEAK